MKRNEKVVAIQVKQCSLYDKEKYVSRGGRRNVESVFVIVTCFWVKTLKKWER